jgi:hypothetical protein
MNILARQEKKCEEEGYYASSLALQKPGQIFNVELVD